MRVKRILSVECDDFDKLVIETYGRPYCLQQQDGCKERGVERVIVPAHPEDFKATTITEEVNCSDHGVAFKAWLARDPMAPLSSGRDDKGGIILWWERNFYPHISMVVNDLHARGLLEAGTYHIVVDW